MMKSVRNLIALLSAAFLTFSAPYVLAGTIVVDPGGGGDHTTIQAAINAAGSNDVIQVKSGVYTENLSLDGITNDINLVAVDGVTTAQLIGSGTKISTTNFSGSLLLHGFLIRSTNSTAINMSSFQDVMVVDCTLDSIGTTASHKGIVLSKSSGSGEILIYNTTISHLSGSTIDIALSGTADYGVTIDDTPMNFGVTNGVVVACSNSASCLLNIAGSSIVTPGSHAVAISTADMASIVGYVRNNTIVNAGSDGLNLSLAGSGTQNLEIYDNIIAFPTNDAVDFDLDGSGSITTNMRRNTLMRPGQTGVNARTASGSAATITLAVDSNSLDTSETDGFVLDLDGASTVNAHITGNTFQNAAVEAFTMGISAGTPVLNLNFDGNTASGLSGISLSQSAGTFNLEQCGANAQAAIDNNNTNSNGPTLVTGTISHCTGSVAALMGNEAPVTSTEFLVTVAKNNAELIDVLSNDSDPETAPLLAFFEPYSQAGGAVVRDQSGTPGTTADDSVTYTPPTDVLGLDKAVYVVEDASGARDVNYFQPFIQDIIVVGLAGQTNVLCNGGATGNATVSASGCTPPYTYSWSNGQTAAFATGLAAGTYTCTITDAGASCTDQVSVTITQPATAISVSAIPTDQTCRVVNDGQVAASATGGTGAYTYLWSNASTAATATGLGTGSYTVTATDGNGCTDVSGAQAVTYPCTMVDQAAMRSRNIQDVSVKLEWDTVCGATSYKLRYKVAGAGSWTTVLKQSNHGVYNLTGLTPNTTYKWSLLSNCGGVWSDPTDMERFVTLASPCAIPDGLSASPVQLDQARLNWNGMTGAVKYKVRWREQGTTLWTTKLKDGIWTYHWATGLSSSTTYEWQAKTICQAGSSGTPWSAIQTFTTPAAMVQMPTSPNQLVSKLQLNNAPSIWPNPTSGAFNLRLDGATSEGQATVTVLNPLGQLVETRSVPINTTTQFVLNDKASGIYLLKIQLQDATLSHRLVVE